MRKKLHAARFKVTQACKLLLYLFYNKLKPKTFLLIIIKRHLMIICLINSVHNMAPEKHIYDEENIQFSILSSLKI